MKKKFKHLKVWEIQTKISNDKRQNLIPIVFKYVVFLLCIFLIIFFGKFLIKWWHIALWFLGQSTVKTVSNNLWQEMKKDDFGNVNVMLIWVGGNWHQGGYLADSMIVASWNPKDGAVTMISIPRDLYINSTWYLWRINGLFARGYNKWWDIGSWAINLIKKAEEILWLTIPYYVIADFQWFKEVVDTLWWIDVYVPNTIHDTTYPDENLWYQTFHISAWQQILDWDTALKYARSRHTTSDFARSQRQQDIIKAVINTALKRENITNVWKLKDMYSTYTRMVHTNVSLKEMIGMFKYAYNFKHIFSFWLNTYCNYRAYSITDAGCFLHNWNREAYWWMAVMVPIWSSPSKISFYEYTQRFAFFVAHNNGYLIEGPRILIKNAIDKNFATQNKLSPTGRANKIAVKLTKYGFTIAWVENYSGTLEQTTVLTHWDNKYSKSIEALQYFLPVSVVEKWNLSLWTGEQLEYDMELIIWNDFISHTAQSQFSYER